MSFSRNHPLSDAACKVCAKLPFHEWREPLRSRIDAFLTPVTVKSLEPTSGNFVKSGLSFAAETHSLLKGDLEVTCFSFLTSVTGPQVKRSTVFLSPFLGRVAFENTH
jgi:hypothetical protein